MADAPATTTTATAAALTTAQQALDALVLASDSDLRGSLGQVADLIDELTAVLAEARRSRDYIALQLREFGMTNRKIAQLARVTDSYLARKHLAAGATPKIRRDANG